MIIFLMYMLINRHEQIMYNVQGSIPFPILKIKVIHAVF